MSNSVIVIIFISRYFEVSLSYQIIRVDIVKNGALPFEEAVKNGMSVCRNRIAFILSKQINSSWHLFESDSKNAVLVNFSFVLLADEEEGV